MQDQSKNHTLIIDNQKTISVTEVDGVLSFNESKITLALVGGRKIVVTGNGLKIVGFSKTDGTFLATGEVVGVTYGAKSLAQRLFK